MGFASPPLASPVLGAGAGALGVGPQWCGTVGSTALCIIVVPLRAPLCRSSALASEIPMTEGPGGLQSVESQRVGHD